MYVQVCVWDYEKDWDLLSWAVESDSAPQTSPAPSLCPKGWYQPDG